MGVLYSVSPHKTLPVSELQGKLKTLGWFGRKTDSGQQPTAGGVGTKTRSNSAKDGTEQSSTESTESTTPEEPAEPEFQMRWICQTIDDVTVTASGSLTRGPLDEKHPLDMVVYSSDVESDCEKIGALLAFWRRTETMVFHIRDEAQSLAKKQTNPSVEAHDFHVAPPPMLKWLREYYSNHFGLSCNVTATHFPTLLEENMWGFIGSVPQLTPPRAPRGPAALLAPSPLPAPVPSPWPLRTYSPLLRARTTAPGRQRLVDCRPYSPLLSAGAAARESAWSVPCCHYFRRHTAPGLGVD